MYFEWIIGALTRPTATFQRARQELRFGYWWIILSVVTLEVVMLYYGSPDVSGPEDIPNLILFVAVLLTLLFDAQSISLWALARRFGWNLTWPEAMKYSGLCWSFLFLEDVLAFYPSLTGHDMLALYMGIPATIWYIIGFSLGVRRLTAFSLGRALVLVTLATLLWRLPWFLLNIMG